MGPMVVPGRLLDQSAIGMARIIVTVFPPSFDMGESVSTIQRAEKSRRLASLLVW
jgi:hypothetical protein